jgi:hypothetical protein
MADLDPEDIKDDEEEEAPPGSAEAEPKEEAPKDLAVAAEHLLVAVTELARAAGSPPAVQGALEQAARALGKK